MTLSLSHPCSLCLGATHMAIGAPRQPDNGWTDDHAIEVKLGFNRRRICAGCARSINTAFAKVSANTK